MAEMHQSVAVRAGVRHRCCSHHGWRASADIVACARQFHNIDGTCCARLSWTLKSVTTKSAQLISKQMEWQGLAPSLHARGIGVAGNSSTLACAQDFELASISK